MFLQTATPTNQLVSELLSPAAGAGALIGVAAAGFLWLRLYRTYDEGYKEYDTTGTHGLLESGRVMGRIDPPSEAYNSFWMWALTLKYAVKSNRHEGKPRRKSESVPTGFGLLLQSFFAVGLTLAGRYYQLQNPSVFPTISVLGVQAMGGFAVALTVVNMCLLAVGLLYLFVVSILTSIGGGLRKTGEKFQRTVSRIPAALGKIEFSSSGSGTDGESVSTGSAGQSAANKVNSHTEGQHRASTAGSGPTQQTVNSNTAASERTDLASESLEGVDTSLDAVLDDFDRREKIGSGGNADVYRAMYRGNGTEREVALKLPRLQEGETISGSFIDEFNREAKTWAALDDHEAIVDVLGWGTTPQPWLALELMQGDLRSRLPLSFDSGIDVICEVADALQHAHRHGIAHRDLKPENILFANDLPDSVRVSDWGLAKVLLDQSQSTSGLTPTYAAPEQFTDTPTNATEYQMTDIYQLGAVAYETFTGQPPFQGSAFEVMEQVKNTDPVPPSEIDDSLPETLDDILLHALAKDPSDRFDTPVHFQEQLRSLD